MLGVHSSSEPDAMPVTARLSKRFYEVLGEDVANELVEWFNMVDATYRADLRELNELNFARFTASVDQRFAEADARLERRLSALEGGWERRIARLEHTTDQRFTLLEARLDQVKAEVQQEFRAVRTELTAGFTMARTEREAALDRTRASLLKWMFGFWVGSAAVTGLARLL